MRATLLGHASYVVEGGGRPSSSAPCFFEPFEATCISCPKRVSPFEPTRIEDLTVVARLSRDPREYGYVFADASACVWDQGDTIVDQRSCVEVAKLLGRPLDVAIVTYMPLLDHAEAWISEEEFPRARYDRVLETALMAQARTVMPGSSGKRHEADREWLNQGGVRD